MSCALGHRLGRCRCSGTWHSAARRRLRRSRLGGSGSGIECALLALCLERIAQPAHVAFQLHDLPMRAVDLGARGHADRARGLLDFLLHGGLEAHLRIDMAAVGIAKGRRYRDVGVGLFRCVDPQVEQCACGGELLAGLAAFAQARFKTHERVLQCLRHELEIRGAVGMEVELRLGQLLPALLMLACKPECRHLGHVARAALQLGQERRGLTHQLLDVHAAKPELRRIERHAHRAAPCLGDLGRARVTTGELRRDLLHARHPVAALRVPAVQRIVHLRLGLRALCQPHPPRQRVIHPGRWRRLHRRCGAAHPVTPLRPVLARQRVEGCGFRRGRRSECPEHVGGKRPETACVGSHLSLRCAAAMVPTACFGPMRVLSALAMQHRTSAHRLQRFRVR